MHRNAWTFLFPNAGLSVSAWPDGTPPFPDGLTSKNWGSASGILIRIEEGDGQLVLGVDHQTVEAAPSR